MAAVFRKVHHDLDNTTPPSGLRPWFGAMRIVVVPDAGTQPANHTANNQSQRPTALLLTSILSGIKMRLLHHTFQKMHLQISKDTNVNAHLERRYGSSKPIFLHTGNLLRDNFAKRQAISSGHFLMCFSSFHLQFHV